MPVQMSVKATGADVVRKGLEDLAAEVPKIARKDIYDMMVRVRGILRKPGRKPSYPIPWDSDKQRRFVLAMLRAAGNLPYRRTDALPSGWDIDRLPLGYRLFNPLTAAVFVFGDYSGSRQSRIHQQRWPVTQEVTEAALEGLPPAMEEHISFYGRKVLG